MNKKERRAHLEEVKTEKRTMVFYEAPHKLLRTLQDMLDSWGDRPIALCREITKLHEECFRTTLEQAVAHYTEHEPRGEFVLVIGGCTEVEAPVEAADLLEQVRELMEQGQPMMSAVKQVAKAAGVSKNKLYQEALEQLK